jgi:hypothetical protein
VCTLVLLFSSSTLAVGASGVEGTDTHLFSSSTRTTVCRFLSAMSIIAEGGLAVEELLVLAEASEASGENPNISYSGLVVYP